MARYTLPLHTAFTYQWATDGDMTRYTLPLHTGTLWATDGDMTRYTLPLHTQYTMGH